MIKMRHLTVKSDRNTIHFLFFFCGVLLLEVATELSPKVCNIFKIYISLCRASCLLKVVIICVDITSHIACGLLSLWAFFFIKKRTGESGVLQELQLLLLLKLVANKPKSMLQFWGRWINMIQYL